METLTLNLSSPLIRHSPYLCSRFMSWFSSTSVARVPMQAIAFGTLPVMSRAQDFPISGTDGALVGFITGKSKVTELAHSVWGSLVQKGDTVVDATCGNGHDMLALLKMVANGSGRGCVYGMDIQRSAIENTSLLLKESVDEDEREMVKLFLVCHSKMETVIPKDTPVRLIVFNLGYLPGGDKTIITMSTTTLMALQSASHILHSGGLISMVVYVGHPGGREELQTVESFASSLPTESWVTCKFEVSNRPTGPVLVLIFKK
ncbi:S-adenosyl-L-methionine-dependent methyltransferase protein [Dioscorea alata]|uniref:S-adenosyl-L-methionine-dependent methyltransferase protein n=1 Tax=Dioscorea alata TaxID=55571 RepID=A0ACB7VI87_DIOAL|nr:S-adenosyl-L-methionine-dependent methyltransferase protein [Dioscorea alata]